jgi:uncharacterized protein
MRVDYLKWPDRLHYTVEMACLAGAEGSVWGRMVRGGQVVRGTGKVLTTGQDSLTLFQPDTWYAARWYRAPAESGRARRFRWYADICTPPEFAADGIRLVDLDLDVAMTWDGEIVVLDEDEFAERRIGYPEDAVEQALAATDAVARAMADRAYPFDGSAEPFWTLDH